MGRVINLESAGKDRTRLTKTTVLAMRELMRQTTQDDTTRDLAAYIALSLKHIFETIDVSVDAWEKKGYWVKADRFRMEWDWSGRYSNLMRSAILNDNWADVAGLVVQIAGKLSTVKLPEHHRLGQPWIGAYKLLIEG